MQIAHSSNSAMEDHNVHFQLEKGLCVDRGLRDLLEPRFLIKNHRIAVCLNFGRLQGLCSCPMIIKICLP